MSAPTVGAPSSPSSPSSGQARPSDERRRMLNQELSIPLVSNFFPIERYYNAADKVYESFEDVLQKGMLDDAYVYGKRYCLFCVDAIPTHNYYHSPKYAAYKSRSVKRVNSVIRALEQIVDRMDDEERAAERRRLEAQRLAEERAAQERQDRLDRFQKSFDQQRRGTTTSASAAAADSTSSSSDVQASALSKLERLNGPTTQQPSSIRRDPSGEPPMPTTKASSCRYRLLEDSDDELATTTALPPPIPPPALSGDYANGGTGGAALPPPPSYDQIRSGNRDFLGLAKGPAAAAAAPAVATTSSAAAAAAAVKAKRRQLPMRSLLEQHKSDYLRLADKGHISVSCLNTYQGRVHDSTNGCTVISALVAANHMIKRDMSTVTNDEITHIIDNVCGPVLRKIRSKLGLPAHALLIPSDVHDQLVDDKVLSQDCFEGASGGSVLDDDHMGEFLKLLSVGESGDGAPCKAAATFFFREHVISIVKYHNSHRQVCYDLIDSLPATVQGRSAATRTRCASLDALRALLNWYCSRKFSDANIRYIDSNKWDDSLADFDPRVFQGFVWMSKQQ